GRTHGTCSDGLLQDLDSRIKATAGDRSPQRFCEWPQQPGLNEYASVHERSIPAASGIAERHGAMSLGAMTLNSPRHSLVFDAGPTRPMSDVTDCCCSIPGPAGQVG